MNKILKRLLTGVLTLATVFTALPTTAVHAAETQYWTESEERVGIVEKVMNDGSIGSTFNEGHMTVEGEDQLSKALKCLPERKRNIILLSYFMDMSDAEIGELMNVVRTTVYRHRTSTLEELRKMMEEE